MIEKMPETTTRRWRFNASLWMVALVVAALFVPWLGVCLFYSKGEPREALVAMSMLQYGNWTLPIGATGDMPYKPPLLAWLIGICAELFNNGHVNEYLARLPSAVAAIVLSMATWMQVRRHAGENRAWATVLIMITSFEVFRAASACRVDMVLTACMVCGIYALASPRLWWRPAVVAVVCLSGAALSKGPVGILLPCAVAVAYRLLQRHNVFATLAWLVVICLLSAIIPGIWYYRAWQIGGDAFASMVWEENIGRLTGTMTYDSHINPWWYNFTSLLAGMLPWTVPALAALCTRTVRTGWRRAIQNRRRPGPLAMLSLTAVAAITLFYCIPASKRSVYLLPCYPFVCYGVACLLHRVRHTAVAAVWAIILAVVAIAAPIAVAVMQFVDVPWLTLTPMPWWAWPIAMLPLPIGLWWISTRARRSMQLGDCLLLTYALLLAYNAAYMPMALNARSDFHATQRLEKIVPVTDQVYGVIPEDSLLRYYSIGFYTADGVIRADSSNAVPHPSWIIGSPEVARTNPDLMVVDTLTMRSADTRRPVLLMRRYLRE